MNNEVITPVELVTCCGVLPDVWYHTSIREAVVGHKNVRGVILVCPTCGARAQSYCGGPEDYYSTEWLRGHAEIKWNKRDVTFPSEAERNMFPEFFNKIGGK